MLKADYNSIIDQYRAFESDIDLIAGTGYGWASALEAEGDTGSSGTGFGGGNITSSTSTAGTRPTSFSAKTPSAQAASQQKQAQNITDASKAAQNTARLEQKNQNQRKNPGKFQEILQKVREFLKKIRYIIDNAVRKLQNRMRLCAQTDKGFFNLYKKRKAMIKPHESVKLISYQYRNNVLEEPVKKLMNEITQCMTVLRVADGSTNTNGRISQILQAPQGKMIEVLVEPYAKTGSSDKISSIPEFVHYLVNSYRGEKQEFVYKATQIPEIERNAMSMGDIKSRCDTYMQAAENAYNQIKTLEYQVTKNQNDEKVLNLVSENTRKAATLYNAFSALINAYFEVRLEQSLNYRVVLRKFYEM